MSAYNPADFVVEVKTGADPVLICKQDSADGQDGASRLPLHGLDCDGIVEALSARGVTQASKPLMSHDAYVQAKGTWAVKKAIRDEDGSLSPEERAASQREDCAAALSAFATVWTWRRRNTAAAKVDGGGAGQRLRTRLRSTKSASARE
eukprot:SAG11_NODE_2119_length_3791_cov_1.549025_2_plen_149_part_00